MKKVLVISFSFPPDGGVGSHRIAKFVKYLNRRGWEVHVLTATNNIESTIDESLLNDVPKSTKVYLTDYFEPNHIFKWFENKFKNTGGGLFSSFTPNLLRFIRLPFDNIIFPLFLVPDQKALWVNNAIKKGVEIVESEGIDVIFSTSPPASSHLVALKIKEKTQKKWVADFRDPWSPSLSTVYKVFKWVKPLEWVYKGFNVQMEKRVLNLADVKIGTTEAIVETLDSKNTNVSNSHVIFNGFDKEDFKNFRSAESEKFHITHLGSVSLDRDIQPFCEALVELVEEKGIIGKNVFISFVGKSRKYYIRGSIKSLVDKKLMEFLPPVSYKESIKFMEKATALLLVVGPNSGVYQIPSKVYEYMAAGKPIIVLSNTDALVLELLKDYGFVFHLNYDDKDQIKTEFRKIFELWKTNKMNRKVNKEFVDQFTREKQTDQLIKIFNSLNASKIN